MANFHVEATYPLSLRKGKPVKSQNRFVELLLPHQAALEAYCRRAVHDGNAVEDVIKAAVATAWRTFDRFKEGTNFEAWIFRILAHEVLNQNRRSERDFSLELQAEIAETDLSAALTLELDYERLLTDLDHLAEHFDMEVVLALDRLNPGERNTFLLRSIGEFTYREIAEILGIPIGSVMGHLARARAKLREALSAYFEREQLGYGVGRKREKSSSPPADAGGMLEH